MSPTYPKGDRVLTAEAGRTVEAETGPRQDFQGIGSEERNWNNSALHAGSTHLNRIDNAGVDLSLLRIEPNHFKSL